MSDLKPYQFEPKRSQPKQGQLQCDRDRSPVRRGDPNCRQLDDTTWCQCGHCAVMATATECVCCSELPRVRELCNADEIKVCITELSQFEDICLRPHVLSTTLVLLHDVTASVLEDPISNR
jgi:hypothetical protein